MPMIFEKDDWSIYQNEYTVGGGGTGYCLRHLGCRTEEGPERGVCGCKGWCGTCKVVAPDEIIGFFKMVKWNR